MKNKSYKQYNPWRNTLRDVISIKSYKYGTSYTLTSGLRSDVFFDMKPTMLDPHGAWAIGNLCHRMITSISPDAKSSMIGGLELGAIPIIIATLAQSTHDINTHWVYGLIVRKQVKYHGTEQQIEGATEKLVGSKVIVVDDVVTTGGSTLQAVIALREAGAVIENAITIIDREEGGKENLKKHGVKLHSIFVASEFHNCETLIDK